MKKLFAMLLALCMMCGMSVAEEAGNQTVIAKLAEFQVPASWELEISQDEGHSFIAYATLPDGEAYMNIRPAEYFSECSTQYDCFARVYMGSHGLAELGDITITENYADMMPDKEPLVIGDCHDGSYVFAHRFSDVVMYVRLEEASSLDNAVEGVLPIFTSVSTPAIEDARDAAPNAPADTVTETKTEEDRVRIGNLTFEIPAELSAEEPTAAADFLFAQTFSGSDYVVEIYVLDYQKAEIDVDVLNGDEQIDSLFWLWTLLGGGDEEAAFAIVNAVSRLDAGLPDGQDLLYLGTDHAGLSAHYYRDVGFVIIVGSQNEEVTGGRCCEIALNIADSFRMDGVSEEEMAAATPEIIGQIVITDGANIRTAPDGNATKIKTAYAGEVYPLLGEEGTWYKIEVDGQVGYVVKGLAKIK